MASIRAHFEPGTMVNVNLYYQNKSRVESR
nr:MAG TPA: hypothetical protein [Caudoviricetes sp.]